jgi:hypothetical protein
MTLASGLGSNQIASAQQKRAESTNETEPLTPTPETLRNRRRTTRTNSANEPKTAAPKKESAISLGSGLYFPISRPTASLAFSAVGRFTELTLRLGGSYRSLSKEFLGAAASDATYSQKISKADAYLWDMDLAVPEFTILLPANFYVSATSFARYTRCVSEYTTSTNSPLVFSGWSLAVGAGGRGGYRYPISGDKFFLEFYGGLIWPLWSSGASEVAYTPVDVAATQTFSTADLDNILDSLQVYLKDLSYQVTTEAGIRAAWRF